MVGDDNVGISHGMNDKDQNNSTASTANSDGDQTSNEIEGNVNDRKSRNLCETKQRRNTEHSDSHLNAHRPAGLDLCLPFKGIDLKIM